MPPINLQLDNFLFIVLSGLSIILGIRLEFAKEFLTTDQDTAYEYIYILATTKKPIDDSTSCSSASHILHPKYQSLKSIAMINRSNQKNGLGEPKKPRYIFPIGNE